MLDAVPPPPAAPTPTPEQTWTPRRIALVVLLALVVVLAVVNLDQTNVSFLVFDVKAPLIIVILAVLAIGFALGYLFRGMRTRHASPSGL